MKAGRRFREKLNNTSFHTRLIVLSIAMVIVPMALTVISFRLIVSFINTTEDFKIETILAGSEIAQIFLIDMVTCVIAILLVSVIIMRRFIQRWFMEPIMELREGMNEISRGNLDYSIEAGYSAEIGELFENYEQMRLRLKQSAEAALENESRNRELVSNISHDLKTPITSIRGYVEGLRDGVADTPEKMERYIRTIYKKTNELSGLINELTLYTSIEQNRLPYNLRRVRVKEFFEDCAQEIGMELEAENIQLDFYCMTDPRTEIIADPEQLRRVINNIISNSIKYRKKENDRVEIRISDEGDGVQIGIEDNGKGISRKDIGHIFERFYRSDASRSSSTGGSGIGLSIVKKVIEDHGGHIWATGEEGKGLCIHIVFDKYIHISDDRIQEAAKRG